MSECEKRNAHIYGHRGVCVFCGEPKPVEPPTADELVAACAPYLKDNETPAQCIQRHRRDVDLLLGLLAEAKGEPRAALDAAMRQDGEK